MGEKHVWVPSARLRAKWRAIAWIVFFLIAPFVLLGRMRGLGWTYVWVFGVANAVWLAGVHAWIGPYHRSLSYELGSEAITVRRGVVTKVEHVVPYRMVTNVSLKRDFLDRRLGLGSLHIHTAGYAQQVSAEARLVGLENYQQAYVDLIVALRRHRPPVIDNGTTLQGDRVDSNVNTSSLLPRILDEVQVLRLEGQDNALQRLTRSPGRRMHDLCPQESASLSALAVCITPAHSSRLMREQRPHRRGVEGGKPPQAS